MTGQPYRPRADSLASQCIAFFRANPDEHLLLDDITDKFGAVRNKRDAAAGHKREYRVARTHDGGARVWRVA